MVEETEMFRCVRLSCRLRRQACIRRQEDALNYNPPTPCAKCEQGDAVATELGVKVKRKKAAWVRALENGRANAAKRAKGRKLPGRGITAWSPMWTPELAERKKRGKR